MREILFRGKRIDNGEWGEGHLLEQDYPCYKAYIVPYINIEQDNRHTDILEHTIYEVAPATVGQYTGLTDKNGKRIFEGDIVHILGNQDSEDWKCVDYTALIVFLDGGFCAVDGTIENHGFRRYALARMDFDMEVIGNIHDNPELLEEEE